MKVTTLVYEDAIYFIGKCLHNRVKSQNSDKTKTFFLMPMVKKKKSNKSILISVRIYFSKILFTYINAEQSRSQHFCKNFAEFCSGG